MQTAFSTSQHMTAACADSGTLGVEREGVCALV